MAEYLTRRRKRRRPFPPAVVVGDEAESEGEDNEEDVHLWQNMSELGGLKFLSVAKLGAEKETEFESRPRPSQQEEAFHYLLPLKSKFGLIQQPAVASLQGLEPEGSDDDASEGHDSEEEADEAPPPILATAELFARRQHKLSERKETIAEIASILLENPEENVVQLKKLLSLCVERDPDVAISVRKLSMFSLMSVFKDICPSYRVRELTAAEKAVKVSKDVRKLRVFEQTLLSSYQQFLTLLDRTAKVGLGEKQTPKRRREGKKPLDMLEDGQVLSQDSLEILAEVSIQCLCELLVALAHFNYRTNVLNVLVPRMNSKALGGRMSRMCCEAIEKVFRSDIVGDVSLEAVQLIAKLVKSRSYKTKPAVLRAFLHLQLHHVDESVGGSYSSRAQKGKEEKGKMKVERMSRKQRKHYKAEAKLERDLRETRAEESKEKKTKLQTEIIKVVFATYFRILKNSRHSPLMQPVLEGLARFSHLVSVDYFSDLMSLLHSLAESKSLSNRECMQCVLTAFGILSGQGTVLNIDPRQFYVHLYQSILQLDTCSSSVDAELALNCLEKMMRNSRQVSLPRVLGFVKRLSTVSLQLLPATCLAVLAIIKQLMHTYSKCEQLLDVEEVGGGVFRPDVSDPEMCQAGSTALWELSALMSSFDPATRAYASYLLKGASSHAQGALHPDLTRSAHKDLLVEFSLPRIPPMANVPPPPAYPAMKLAPKRKGKEVGYYYHDPGIRTELVSTQISFN